MTASREVAADFPVRWADPNDAAICWQFDLTHTPEVMTPLGYDLYYGPFINGFGWIRACYHNYYVFLWDKLPGPGEGDRPAPDLDRLAAAVRRWHSELIPEVEGYTQRFLRTDFDALSDDELASEVEKLPELRHRMGELHTLALFPFGLGMPYFISTYKELTAIDDDLAALRLVQGYGSKSVEAGVALWKVSRLAASIPSVAAVLREGRSAPETMDALRRDTAAQPFLEAFEAFLDEFGWRADLFELSVPAWAEDPTIPLQQLRAYLDLADYDPAAEQQQLAAEREAAITETMAALDAEARAKLQTVLDVAKDLINLQEDHNYYIDQRCAFSARRLIVAAARRLVSKGLLSGANDVFYLHATDLVQALRGDLADARPIVESHRAGMQRWSAVTPPSWVGVPPPKPANGANDGASPASLEGHDARELRGSPASAGVGRGPARVLMNLAEGDRFRPGDVLVARTTMPAWTPLFAPAAAIITETGGVLSHAAVTAREYATPAVLNVENATTLIRDGQLVEVDGTNGTVRLLG
jgi:pyruvate,water dikinase